jgi:hypothetical protein
MNTTPRVTFTSMFSGVISTLVRRFDWCGVNLMETTAGMYGDTLMSAIVGDNLCPQGGSKLKDLRSVSDKEITSEYKW